MKTKAIISFILFLNLIGCSSFLAPLPKAPKTYLLNNVTVVSPAKIASQKTLLVSQISSNNWLDTSRMAYQLNNHEMSYFAENQWIAPPGELLQPIIVQAISSSKLYRTVVPAPFNGNYDQRLDIQLLDMQQVFTQKPSVYQMSLQAELVDRMSQRVISSRQFHIIVPTPSDNPEGGVMAANRAVNEFIVQLIQFIHAKKP